MSLRVGLTGGIGSGKTTVARIFESLGIPVYYADLEAKRIMNEDPELKKELVSFFGDNVYKNNKLNRQYLAELVFENKEMLERLNAIVHPATIKDGERWMKGQSTPYALKEAALIFESGVNKHLDYVIGVSAPESLRIARTSARDGLNPAEVFSRIKNQMPEDEKMKLCDFVVVNDEQQLLVPQVLDVHNRLLELARQNPPGPL